MFYIVRRTPPTPPPPKKKKKKYFFARVHLSSCVNFFQSPTNRRIDKLYLPSVSAYSQKLVEPSNSISAKKIIQIKHDKIKITNWREGNLLATITNVVDELNLSRETTSAPPLSLQVQHA